MVDNRDIMILSDMMYGEINRMCVTHDLEELFSLEKHLLDNTRKMWELNHERIISNGGSL